MKCKTYILFIFIPAFCFSQEKNNSLLWEISGNGLNKPSYLFGTMHISDEKFFNFSDSVFIAIESVESFAAEVSLDSMQYIAIKLAESNINSGTDITKILTKEELELLNKKLKEKLGTNLESLPVKNPAFISFMLKMDMYKGNMPFSIDEYLYKVAKRNNKKILGIENIDDQINLFMNIPVEEGKEWLLQAINEDEDESKQTTELFDAYLAEDLDKINDLTSSAIGENTEMDTKFLSERNFNMAQKIDQFAKEIPVFAAVGAAHLPGKKGVISILKEKGYRVRPVQSKRTGLAEKYKNEMIKPAWVPYSPPSGGFTIEMPGSPMELPMPGNSPGAKVESCFYSESETNYIVVKYIYPEVFNSSAKDSVINSFIKNLRQANYILERDIKDIQTDNLEGKEFKAKVSGFSSISKIFLQGNSLYWIQVLAPENKISSPSAIRFFNSLKIIHGNN